MKSKLLIFGISMLVMVAACKHKCLDSRNPECKNYNPCWDKKPASAEIEIFFDNILINKEFHDSVFLKGTPLTFRSKYTAKQYDWKLGAESLFVREYERGFNAVPAGQYEVSLRTLSEPNKACFSDDKEVNSKTQQFYFVNSVCDFHIYGSFKVLFDGAADSSIVRLRGWDKKNWTWTNDTCGHPYGTAFFNFKNENDTMRSGDGAFLYNSEIWFTGSEPSRNLLEPQVGYFKTNQLTGTVESKYIVKEKWYNFKGRKL